MAPLTKRLRSRFAPPYLQLFLGLSEFREDYLFDPSMMGHFRARFGEEAHQRINTAIIEKANPSTQGEHPKDNDDDQSSPSTA